jgi:Family of unknown function (DUF6526)
MKEQSFKNHTRMVPSFHYVTFGLLAACLVIGVLMFFDMSGCTWLLPVWMVLMVLNVMSVAFHARAFALKVQDRAIRAEESLRYFVLSGKRIDPNLRLRQYIALRFASDAEFVALADRAAAEKLEPAAIKAAIQNWRADHHRA